MAEANKIKGKRRLERVEVKGDPYDFIFKSGIHENEKYGRILEFLYDIRVAKTSQIQEYLGVQKSSVSKLLRFLYINNFIYRVFPKTDRGSSQGYYFLDNMGAFYLAAVEGIPKRDFPWAPKDNLVGIDKLEHTLGITQIRLAIEVNAKKNMSEVIQFHGEKRTGRRKFVSSRIDKEINPDAELKLHYKYGDRKRSVIMFFEYDRGTEDLYKVKDKIKKYIEYYSSDEFKAVYDINPYLIILCDGELSERRFQVAIDERKNEIDFKILMGSFDKFISDPFGEVLFDRKTSKYEALIKKKK